MLKWFGNPYKIALKKPVKKDQELVREMDARRGTDGFTIWWLGQSGYLIQWQNKRILLDPYLSDSLTKKYAHTDKPHERISERVVAPELLLDINIVSSSHNHTDHLDGETLQPLFENNPEVPFIIPEANRAFVAERTGKPLSYPIGLNDGISITIDGVTFHGIPAKHNTIERDENGYCKCMGYVISFDKWNIYHSGDTLWFDEMIPLLQPFHIDLALLPINGNDPARKVAGNLDTKEAAVLAKSIGAKMVVPCHYDLFAFNTADPTLFEKEAQTIEQPYRVLPLGGFLNSRDI